jgi:hypothetical protein
VCGVPRRTPLRTIMARQVEFYGAYQDDRSLIRTAVQTRTEWI